MDLKKLTRMPTSRITVGVEKIFRYFHARFKGVSRPQREEILCAMIRINYGTPWSGDHELLSQFFPSLFHDKLVFGGLTELIEALSPFSDEQTDSGLPAPSLSSIEREIRAADPAEKTFKSDLEITVSLEDVTTDLPPETEPQTVTVRLATT